MNQSLSFILFRYIGTRFISGFFTVFGGLLLLIYLLDSLEVMRRLSKFDNFTLSRMLGITTLKLPEVGLDLMPFAILIAAVFTFWRLTRTSELVVVRATGVSAWQFLAAPVVIGVMLAVLKMLVLNPIAAVMIAQYEQLETRYLSSAGSSTVKIARTGVWLRQKTEDSRVIIIHAATLNMPHWTMQPVTAFFYDSDSNLTHRIDAEKATLKKGQWVFTNAWSNEFKAGDIIAQPVRYPELRLPTTITGRELMGRFSSPRTVPFWNLPQHARVMRSTGFESNPLWAHFYSLLAEPLLNIALVCLAGALALRAPRQQKGWWLVLGTLAVGFVVFFLGDFLEALGISEKLPLPLASFAPAILSLLMGLTALLYLEDG